jgi:chromosome partitioning protein
MQSLVKKDHAQRARCRNVASCEDWRKCRQIPPQQKATKVDDSARRWMLPSDAMRHLFEFVQVEVAMSMMSAVVQGFGQQLGQQLQQHLRQTLGQQATPAQQAGRGRVIAVAAQKGGVGKTTTAVNLAVALSQDHGLSTLLVDLDNQGHVASSLRAHVKGAAAQSVSGALLAPGMELDLRSAVVATNLDRLWLTGADKQLGAAEAQLATRIGREMLLARALRGCRQQFDAIVLDCPPNLGLLTLNALLAADHVLVPCDLSVLALEGVDDLMNTIGQLEMTFGRAPQILGLLHTRVDKRNHKQNAAIRRAVAQRYAGLAMETEIAVNTSLPTAQLHGTSVFSAAPDSTGARDYAALAAEVRAKVFA